MFKKMIAWLLLITVTATAAIGGTLAYLTDRDSEANVFTTGDVDISLEEKFEQDSELLPGQDIEKDVQIKNEGPNEAWVWYTYAVPQGLETGLDLTFTDNTAWTEGELLGTKEVDGVTYNVYASKYSAKLPAGETTSVGLTKVTMDSAVDITPEGDAYLVVNGQTTNLNWNINKTENPVIFVNAYAIQTEGFADVDDAFAAFAGQWGNMVDAGSYEVPVDEPAVPVEIKVSSPEELREAMDNPDLAPGTVINGDGVTVILDNNQKYLIPGGITLKNVTFISRSRSGEYMVMTPGVGETITFEKCTLEREELGMVIIAAETAEGPNMVFNECTFNGPIAPNFVEKADGYSQFNNCVFGLSKVFVKHGYVNCMGGTHTFTGCKFDYTGGSTMGSNQYVRWNAVNSYSESYSTAVVLEGCTFSNCGTQRYGSNSTLTIK